MIKIKTTVFKGLKKINKLPFDKALQLAGMELQGLISDEADKGRGYRGSFRRYSAGYRKTRTKRSLGTMPNLQVTGDMLRSVFTEDTKARKTSNGWVIKLVPPKRKHKGGSDMEDVIAGNDARRPFFGVSRRYEREMQKVVIKFLSKEYAKLQLS